MEALDTRGWKIVPGHFDNWNAKQGSTLRIELRGEIVERFITIVRAWPSRKPARLWR